MSARAIVFCGTTGISTSAANKVVILTVTTITYIYSICQLVALETRHSRKLTRILVRILGQGHGMSDTTLRSRLVSWGLGGRWGRGEGGEGEGREGGWGTQATGGGLGVAYE